MGAAQSFVAVHAFGAAQRPNGAQVVPAGQSASPEHTRPQSTLETQPHACVRSSTATGSEAHW
jgi:hypothetical protein